MAPNFILAEDLCPIVRADRTRWQHAIATVGDPLLSVRVGPGFKGGGPGRTAYEVVGLVAWLAKHWREASPEMIAEVEARARPIAVLRAEAKASSILANARYVAEGVTPDGWAD